MLCLCLLLLSTVAVSGTESKQIPNESGWGNRLDMISPSGWPILHGFSQDLMKEAELVSVAYQDNVPYGNTPRWHTRAVLHDRRKETYLHELYPYYNVSSEGTNTRRLVEISGLSVKDIRFGRRFIAILTEDGAVWTAGLNTYRQLSGRAERRPTFSTVQGLPVVKRLAVGAYHCVVLTDDNRLFSWGHGGNGALGIRRYINFKSIPVQFSLGQEESVPISICCSWGACMAMTKNGEVFTWGHWQQIGRSGMIRVPRPVQGIPEGETIVKAECAVSHMVVLTASGKLYGWGQNTGSLLQAASWSRSATALDLGGKVVRDVVAGNYLTIVKTDAGEIYYFGDYNGQSYTTATQLLYPRDQVVYPRDLLAKGNDGQDSIGAVPLGGAFNNLESLKQQ